MAAQILVEEEGLHHFAKGAVVRYPLVEVEVRVHDVLNHLLDLVIEGQPHVLAGVHAGGRVERRVLLQPFHHLMEGNPVLRPEIQSETLVQFGDDPRQGLDRILGRSLMDGARPGIEGAGAPWQHGIPPRPMG